MPVVGCSVSMECSKASSVGTSTTLFAGKTGDAAWERVLQAIKERFKWSDWEEGKFTQCGVVVQQSSEGFELSQPTYLEKLHEISVNASRRKDRSQPTTDMEPSVMGAIPA